MLSSFFDNILTKQGWKQVVNVVVLPFCTVKSYKKYNFIINSLRLHVGLKHEMAGTKKFF